MAALSRRPAQVGPSYAGSIGPTHEGIIRLPACALVRLIALAWSVEIPYEVIPNVRNIK